MQFNDVAMSGLSSENVEQLLNNNKVAFEDAMYYEDLLAQAKKSSRISELELELKNINLSAEERKKKELEIQDEILKCERQASKAAHIYKENLYASASKSRKLEIKQNEATLAKNQQERLKKQLDMEIANIMALGLAKEDEESRIYDIQQKYDSSIHNARQVQIKAEADARKLESDALKEQAAENNAYIAKQLKTLNFRAIKDSASKTVKEYSDKLDKLEADYANAESDEKREEIRNQQQEIINEKFLAGIKGTFADAANKISGAIDRSFEEAEHMLTTYQSQIDARLQGSDKTYDDIMGLISTNLAISPYVQTQKVIEKMKNAVDKGINYNLEQRAFLGTISEKIANTFDAFDSNLTRLIKLQQADSTAARLGMEASLTKFFNNMFEDTSYLSDLSDSVAAAIIDANSQLDRNQSAEFEYVVQKWLGSLSSLGMSESTITNIAQGLNYLATGDVTSLSNNTSLQTLFAMSSAKAGLEYSDLLLNGLNADNTNKLFESMVEYLKEIAENSDSQVVKAAYGDIFNMSLSDMKAISNLSSSDIANISSNMLSYGGMNSELNWQLVNLSSRVNMAEQLSNLYNNAVFGVAEDMVSDPVTFAMTKMLNFMDGTGIDMAIPFVNAAGFGLDVNTSVQDIMRLGLGIAQATSLMTNILGGLGSGGGLNLDAWGASETVNRGSGLTFTTASRLGGTSGSTYVSSGSMSDMKASSLNQATDDATESAEITNKNLKAEYTIADFYKATVGDVATEYVKTKDQLFELVYNSDVNFLSVRDSHLIVEEGNLRTADSGLHNILKNDTIKVKPQYDALSVHISSIADTLKSNNNTVSLAKGTTVKIDKETLVTAFKEAMGINEKDEVQNIGDLIEGLKDGSIVVRVGNELGTRLQVDTELSGTSGYVSQINW